MSNQEDSSTRFSRFVGGCETNIILIIAILILAMVCGCAAFNQLGRPISFNFAFVQANSVKSESTLLPSIYLTNSSNGRLLANLNADGQIDILQFDISGTTPISISLIAQSAAYSETNPLWSPTGRNLAFVSDRDGTNQIFITTRQDVQAVTTLTTTNGLTIPLDSLLVWSPDGSRIAFLARGEDSDGEYSELFVVDINSHTSVQLTKDKAHVFTPVWVDTNRLAYVSLSRKGKTSVMLRSADGVTSWPPLYVITPTP